MPYVVTQSCCADASCVVACPVNCIHPAPGEPGFAEAEMVYVDPRACVDCGACATACPVDAIKPHTRLSDAELPFLDLNASYFDAFPHADRAEVAPVPQQRRLLRQGPFRVAVVGAGPAGMYTADELLKHPEISVDVLDRLPTPYGLARAGVAPDHLTTRQVSRLFAHVERLPRFGYLLDVGVGTADEVAEGSASLTHDELAAAYDAVVYAVGASADRRLGIDGEDLPGSMAATDLVGWYNGHPDHQHHDVRLDADALPEGRVVVVGNGNVALDVARLLASDAARIEATDMALPAREALTASGVREVVVLGRRGPAQAAFTVPEIVGLLGLAADGAIEVVVDTAGEALPDDEIGSLLGQFAACTPAPGARRLVLRFLASPTRIAGEDRVSGVEVAITRLVERPDGAVAAEPTGETETIPCGLVLRSVGYRGRAVAGLPFDHERGVVPHERGRVAAGTYVAGWIKRGPTGFLGTNKADAEETVARILDDLDAAATPAPTAPGVEGLLASRGSRPVDLEGWRRIAAAEQAHGATHGVPRLPITDISEQRRVAADEAGGPAEYAARARGRLRAGRRLLR